jgi:hypothetical protein
VAEVERTGEIGDRGEALMTRDEAKQLLGGYATGSLTESERKALFDAALDDQELFEDLAGEQDLKEILALPGAKERLAAAVTAAGATTMSAPEEKKKRAWWLFALAGVASVGLLVWVTTSANKQDAVEVATVETPLPAEVVEPKLETPPEFAPGIEAAVRAEKEADSRKVASEKAAAEKSARTSAPKRTTAQTAALEKSEAAAVQRQAAPLPPLQSEPPRPATAANGFAPGAGAGIQGQQGRADAAAFAAAEGTLAQAKGGASKGKAAAARPDSPPVRAGALTYILTGRGSLKVTPAVSGSLEVTAGDRHIIGWDPVVADSTVEMPVPSGVESLTLRFAIPGQQPSVVVIPIRQ